MRLSKTCFYVVLFAWVLCASLLVRTHPATAGETIRYKFTAGDKFSYKTTQKMEMSITRDGIPPVETTTDINIDMVWIVREVKEDASAVIEQTTKRFQINTEGVPGMEIEVDTASDKEVEGTMAKMIAPALKAMTGAPFIVTLSSRGEPITVEVPEQVTDALKKMPGAAQMGEMFTEEGFKKNIQQGAIVFPEGELTKGQEWSTTIEMKNPALGGKQTVEMKYRYDGQEEVDGQMLDTFAATMTMDFGDGGAGPLGAKMTITEQQSEGTIYFDREAGRMKSASIDTKMKMALTAAGNVMEMQIDQKLNVVVEPIKE